MKKMKYILTVFITVLALGISVQLTACGMEENPADSRQGDEYRAELTEEEMEGGRVSFQMDENLIVEADVTPKEKYENGLSSYYLKVFCETDKESEKKFLQAPTLSRHGFGEWEDMLNRIVPGKFKNNAFEINEKDADIQQAYQGKGGKSYSFHVNWSTYMKQTAGESGFIAPVITVSKKHGNSLFNTAKNVRKYARDYHGSSQASFQQEAGQMKEFLQEMTGRSVYDGYDFSVVSGETIGLLNQSQPLFEEYAPEEEYAALYFYYDIDGLPFKSLQLDYVMENDETADKLCYWSSMPGQRLTGLSENEQALVTGQDGVLYLECSNMWDAGEIYKEKLPIVSPNEALNQVKEHYSRQLVKEDCTVTEIRLVYTGYFSDGADGEIKPTVSPFWAVKVYDGDSRMYIYFVYDAYTGECVREGV